MWLLKHDSERVRVDTFETIQNSLKNSIDTVFDQWYKTTWTELYETAGVFRYKLNIKHQKILVGEYSFLLQINTERATKRRVPEKIDKIFTPFDETKFNFTKISKNEIMFEVQDIDLGENDGSRNIIIINDSPIYYRHSLFCPCIDDCLPQVITLSSLELVSHIMFISSDKNLRIGFNSVGAMASVNHLHYHIMDIDFKLPIEYAKCHQLKNILFELSDYPAKGFCFQISKIDEVTATCQKIYLLILFLMENNIAHNLFLTKGNGLIDPHLKVLRIILWIRTSCFEIKDVTGFYLALCEFAGYFPIRGIEYYEELDLKTITNALKEVTTSVFHTHRNEIINLF